MKDRNKESFIIYDPYKEIKSFSKDYYTCVYNKEYFINNYLYVKKDIQQEREERINTILDLDGNN